MWLQASALILAELEPMRILPLFVLFVAVFLSDPRLHGDLVILVNRKFDHSGTSLHPPEGTIASIAGLPSVEKLDAIIVAPEVIVMIVAAKDSFDVADLLEGCIQTCIHRLTADGLVFLSMDRVKVPHVLELRKRNMEESVSWKSFTIFLDQLLALFSVPGNLIGVDATPA